MRIDWFLPALRRPKPGVPDRREHLLTRVARRVFPQALFSNRETKQRGLLRRLLRKLGISWLSSPLRRASQSVCFVAFLALFFYICWPYTAQPAKVYTGFLPAEFDVATGKAKLVREEDSLPLRIAAGTKFYLDDSALGETAELTKVPFVVERAGEQELAVRPAGKLSAATLELLSFSMGPWTLRERPANAWPDHYTTNLQRKERLPAELFLIVDPLVAISTALAAKAWVWSLVWAGAILLVCVFIPRGFCGYLCPLGTLIDLFDWSIGSRVTRFRVGDDGWWVHIKYYLLLGTLVASLCGILVSGYVSAIPVITRGMFFLFSPLQTGLARGWHQVPPLHAGHVVSIALFFTVLGLGFFRPRFWCKYVCPSGAVFSLGNLFRATERKVESTCINCNKCVEVCPFDAIKPDFTTRTTDCTLCQTCGGVCPTHAIKFVDRLEIVNLKMPNDPPTGETPIGRRGFLSAATGTAAGIVGAVGAWAGTKSLGANLDDPAQARPVRPPGSVPEEEFLQMCIRCGECYQACPNDVLQPLGFQQGLEGLWTPHVVANWAGCESSCNACGQVCPTGAIRALPLAEKKVARMGLAIVNQQTCLPFAGREACQLCVDECNAAGYEAIEFIRVGTEVDALGLPVEDSGYLAPVVLADKCVGCGLCQTRCYGINTAAKGMLEESAIIIEAGTGKEDRMMKGSYVELREQEQRAREHELEKQKQQTPDSYLPDFLSK